MSHEFLSQMKKLWFIKPALVEEARSFQIFVGLSAAVAAVVCAIVGFLYVSNLSSVLSLITVGALFLTLIVFFATAAYRLIKNKRSQDGGLLPRWMILIGSLLLSAYYVIYVAFPSDKTAVQLALAILGIPLFAWIGIRTFRARGQTQMKHNSEPTGRSHKLPPE